MTLQAGLECRSGRLLPIVNLEKNVVVIISVAQRGSSGGAEETHKALISPPSPNPLPLAPSTAKQGAWELAAWPHVREPLLFAHGDGTIASE